MKESNIGLYLLCAVFFVFIIIPEFTREKHPDIALTEPQVIIKDCIYRAVNDRRSISSTVTITKNLRLTDEQIRKARFCMSVNNRKDELSMENRFNSSGPLPEDECNKPMGTRNKSICASLFLGEGLFVESVAMNNENKEMAEELQRDNALSYSLTQRPVLRFKGAICTVDCSGHEAGYYWAEENYIDDLSDCYNESHSFQEGCEIYVDEQQDSY